jgi:Fe-S-cluster containining protein
MIDKKICHPDCMRIDCGDACCRYGADVFPSEYEQIIASNVASARQFTKPYTSEGDLLYRTRVRNGGCIFLMRQRGCRLHASGHKPLTCRTFPRDMAEAEEAFSDGYLPCFDMINGKDK